MPEFDNLCNENRKRIDDMEKTQIVMCEDIKHIKNRIDNGISSTITKIWDKVNGLSELQYTTRDNTFWVSILKKILITVGILGVLSAGLGVVMGILKSGVFH